VSGSRTEPRRRFDRPLQDDPTPAALVGAVVHPLRREILRTLHEAEEARSPRELALALDCGLSSASYHVRVLADTHILALTDAMSARGSTEHFYASAVEDDGWLQLVLIATQGRDRGP
jgi:DNA-binding transcriptional ArsR family regulator